MFNRSSSPGAETEKWALPRRDFLVLGSAAVLGAAASSVTASTLVSVAAPEAGSVLSIGYAPVAAEDAAVLHADTLRFSDNTFRDSGVRVTVHGFSAPEKDSLVSVHLSTFVRAGESAVPFLAWSHSARAAGPHAVSPRASFLASLDENGTLPFAIERSERSRRWSRLFTPIAPAADTLPELAKLEATGNVCRLSSGARASAPLRAGTYFIALRRTASERQPDWSSITVDATAADASNALRRNGRPVDFEYVAITVAAPVA
jgi:hypothetical protein